MKNFAKILLTVGLCAIANAASAAFITGSIAFGTRPGATWAPTGGTGVADATGVVFIGPGGSGDEGQVTSGLGTYSAVTLGTTVDFMDFTFNPFTSPEQLWSFTDGATYGLSMTTLSIVSQTGTQINLTGTGLLSATGFDDTEGLWDLTLNRTGGAFSFSSSAAVPEPSVVLLLGAGLLGLGITRRMRKAA